MTPGDARNKRESPEPTCTPIQKYDTVAKTHTHLYARTQYVMRREPPPDLLSVTLPQSKPQQTNKRSFVARIAQQERPGGGLGMGAVPSGHQNKCRSERWLNCVLEGKGKLKLKTSKSFSLTISKT